jgi:hypothetical protein
MKKKTIVPLISVIIFVILTGCLDSNQENNIKIHYQTFYSNNMRLPDALAENLTQAGINEIVELGKALSFQIDYPLEWEAEYNMVGIGIFSVIFYPENAENIYLKSVTFNLIIVHQNTTINKIKPQYHIPFTSYTEKIYNLNDEIDVWKITGTPKSTDYTQEYLNYGQGVAHILYDNSEQYFIQTFFNDSDAKNMKIFDDMINSFSKIE